MYVTITEIELKSIWHFFKLSQLALGITLQMKKSNGFREFKKTGFGKKHYTISQWDSQIDMKNFATSANHLAAMKQSAKLANKIVTLSYESESIPEWKEAKILLESKGKVIQW
jgi:heme-degrading monooxygenase HmoA